MTPSSQPELPASQPALRRCLLVAGMHRSGTSALARALAGLGADMPANLLGAEAFNTEGHWEPERIVAVNEELLQRLGSSWDDLLPADLSDLPRREMEHYEVLLGRLIHEEFGSSRLFVLKDPRVCRMVGFYARLLRSNNIEPLVLLPFRHPLEVAQSLARRNAMTQAYAGLLWLRHIVDAEAASRGLPRSFSRYERLIEAPEDVLGQVAGDLGTAFPAAPAAVSGSLRSAIRPDLQHHAARPDELERISDASGWIRSAFEALLRLETDPQDSAAMAALDAVRSSFNSACAGVGAAGIGEFRRRETLLGEELAGRQRANTELTAQLSYLTAELDRQRHAREKAETISQSLLERAQRAEARVGQLAADREELATRHAAMVAELEARHALRVTELEAQSAYWEGRLADAQRAHGDEVGALTSSTSWKITRPLRGVKRALTEKGFARSLLRGTARRGFHLLPLPESQKRRLSQAYHQRRLKNQLPVPALPAAPPPGQVSDGPGTSALPMVPPDGRWNVEEYAGLEPRLQRLAEALGPQPDPSARAEDGRERRAGPPGLTSLVVRTYAGRDRLLARALESVCNQDEGQIEVLVVEDGGDSLAGLVAGIRAPEGISLRHIALQKAGRSHAANAGLEAARGDFIGFLDDDDYLLPGHVATLRGLLAGRPDLDAAHSAALEIAADIDPATGQYGEERPNAVFLHPLSLSSDLLNRNHFPIQSVLFRRDILGPQDRFDPNLDALEDWLFWMRLLVGRRVAASASITSAFYVPASLPTHQARMKAHLAAEPYFLTQRKAFSTARGITDPAALAAASRARMEAALAAAGGSEDPARLPVPAAASLPFAQSRRVGRASGPARAVAFTSINLRYLPKALAWARSVKASNPDWETHILLNDAVPEGAADWPCVDVVFPINALGVPSFLPWAFGMRVVELCTATKPFYARRLLEEGYDHVFYFDPDTYVYNDLELLVDAFGEDDVLITPHCTEPAVSEAEIHYNEMSSLAHGVFNLGFLGLRNSPTAVAVADFWSRRLLRHCADDHGRGLFTDQKWFNLVPVFFDRVRVLRHKGCNTASWNIASRPLSRRDGILHAGDDPLIFFHFSGYDRNTPRTMFDVFGQFNETLAGLIDDYDQANDALGRKFPVWQSSWAYGAYEDGSPIPDAHREIYRRAYENELIYDQPYATGPGSFRQRMQALGEAGIARLTVPAGYIRRYF